MKDLGYAYDMVCVIAILDCQCDCIWNERHPEIDSTLVTWILSQGDKNFPANSCREMTHTLNPSQHTDLKAHL